MGIAGSERVPANHREEPGNDVSEQRLPDEFPPYNKWSYNGTTRNVRHCFAMVDGKGTTVRLRSHQRLAMAEAALMIPDLIAAIRNDPAMSRVKAELTDGQMREKFTEDRTIRAKALAPAKKMNVGRNEPCPCGSGMKFKRCCIRKS